MPFIELEGFSFKPTKEDDDLTIFINIDNVFSIFTMKVMQEDEDGSRDHIRVSVIRSIDGVSDIQVLESLKEIQEKILEVRS